ncbi:peroxiredoxin [Lysinibacillus sp. BW-2-10]|uniref:peroxiredoxin family protein n=1 Tax=Lysinibacillus sp. BW-2-10 TaxID=2590030 RepID=UPI00117DD25D|nr:TlpA disulfide reductase family protein [Lysinibacillus sp. BW-2-10]TSI10070.1 TlpA family protein disulfide reductase [Lysinibacillus sp. BW-2-10]
MGKKLLSLSITIFLLSVIIYTIYTNLKESTNKSVEVREEDLLQEFVDIPMDDTTITYQMIEEPVVHDHEEHAHEEGNLPSEVRTLNSEAPDFKLQTLTGETVKLSNFKGKKVFINFWATWCPPCVDEMPEIESFYKHHAEKNNVVVLSINSTDLETNKASIEKFVQELHLTFPVLLDEEGAASYAYQVLTIPTSIIINEEGKLVEQIIGPVTEEMLIDKLSS